MEERPRGWIDIQGTVSQIAPTVFSNTISKLFHDPKSYPLCPNQTGKTKSVASACHHGNAPSTSSSLDLQTQILSTFFKGKGRKGEAGMLPASFPIGSGTVLICMADWIANYRVEYF